MISRRSFVIVGVALVGLAPATWGQGEAEARPDLGDVGRWGGPMIEDAAFAGADAAAAGAGGTIFLRAAGSNFVPRDSDTAYSYRGGGCVQRDDNAGDSWFTWDVQVPDGAVIDYLRVYYYDNDGTYNVNSELWSFDSAGGATRIAEADSTGAPGYSSAGSGFFSHAVSTLSESLVVVASIQAGVGNSLALCGARLRYLVP